MSTTFSFLLRKKSEQCFAVANKVMPGGVNSPVRAFSDLQMTPLISHSGYLDMLQDIDGNQFIDFCNSWGALLHGHAHPLIVEAAQKQVALGTSFGTLTESEVRLAKKILSYFDSIEKIRFVSSGTEATMSAIRLARAYTGRNLILKFDGNYHGHADPFLVNAGSGVAMISTASSEGVPADYLKNTFSIPYNDIEACRALFTDTSFATRLAAVIVEPVASNMGVVPAKREFLDYLREETLRYGALLIFDEVVTGFRLSLEGAQSVYSIVPDLTCLGKIIGGGFAAAAFGGSGEIMNCLAPLGKTYQAGTLSGNPVAMEAGAVALSLAETPGFYQTLREKTSMITVPVREAIKNKGCHATLQEETGMFTLFFGVKEVETLSDAKRCDLQLFKQFYHFAFEQGLYFSPSQFEANFISSAHSTAHLIKARDVLLEGIDRFL